MTLKVTLSHRVYGRYTTLKECLLPVEPDEIITPLVKDGRDDFGVNEIKLLEILPKGFLPCSPNKCLLTVDDDSGGIGIRELEHFRPFAKYFHSYAIGLYYPQDEDEAYCEDD